jgi:hypothetical protein
MKTIRLISAGALVLFGISVGYAQETDTTIVDTAQTAKIMAYDITKDNPAQERWRVETTSPDQSGFHFGIRYQPTFSRLDFRTEDDNTVRADFNVSHGWAISFNMFLNNYVGTHLDVIYSRIEQTFTDRGRRRSAELDYVHIPLLLSLHTNYGRPVSANIHFGPQLGLNINANLDVEASDDEVVVRDPVLRVNPMDISIAYGGGLDFGIGANRNFHINLGYRGSYGLIDIEDSDAQLGEEEFLVLRRSKLNLGAAYIGLMFKL